MNLNDALKQVRNYRNAEYFKWKHDVRYDQRLEKKTEEEFLKYVQRRTMNSFISWERTAEYKMLLTLLLESKLADDLEEIYNIVTKSAKKGDDKAVRLFMSLQKEISSNAKVAKEAFKVSEVVEEDEEDEDIYDLVID